MYLKKELYGLIKTDESIFDFIQESALDGLWYWDLENPENEWMNAKFWTVLGYNPDEMPHKSTAWQNIINQDDLKLASENFTKHCENPNHPYDQVVKYTHKNGSTIWIRCRGLAIRDKDGKPIRMLGAHQDVSDIKNREQELIEANEKVRESQEKYRAFYNNAPLSYQSLNENGCFIDINPMWSKTLGYERNEVIGKWYGDFLHPNYVEHFRKNFPAFKKRGYISDVQFKLRRKDNTYIYVSFEGCVGYTPEGKFKQTYCVFKDITEQKALENALVKAKNTAEESEIRYRTFVSNAPVVSFVLNPNGIFTLSEGKGLEKLGLKPGEVVGLSALELYKDYPVIIHEIKKTLAGSFSRSEITLPGVVFDISYNPVFDNEGNLKEVIGIANDITERKQAEIEVEKQKLELEEYFENDISADYLASAEGEIFSCNRTFIEMFGFDEKIQANKFNIIKLYRNPDVWEKLVALLKKTGKTENYEVDFVARDGKIIHAVINAIGIFDDKHKLKKIRGYVVDITKQKNVEKELLKLSRAVEQSPSSVIVTDSKGNIEYVNPKTLEITGYTKEELIGNNPRIFSSGEKPKSGYQQLWNTISSANEWVGEFHNKKKNGELYWESASISPILNQKQEIINYVAIKEDITERKKFIEDLKIAKEKAEESDRLKSAFLANMSHEIRTPMNGILGFTELLREPDLSSEQKETYIDIVNQSGQRMLNTVNDIVEISKIEAGIVTVDLKEVDIQLHLDELIRFFIPEATKKGLKLILENEVPKAVALISTDQNKIDSILTNLLKNAIKFTKAGEIRIGCIVHEKMLEFYVKDTGIGIPDERKQAVFERFIQADIVNKDARQGSGLGLAITKAYVEMLGGEIRVESKINQGSTFFFTLPLNGQVQEKAGKNENGNQDEKTSQIKGLHIVIAEDDETSALYLQTILQTESNKIMLTKNGNETVEACRNIPGIDLVLIDIQMPDLNGYEATRQIRQFDKNVIIIAQTAFGLSGDREKAIDAGCNDYIAKPIKKEELRNLINKYFGY